MQALIQEFSLTGSVAAPLGWNSQISASYSLYFPALYVSILSMFTSILESSQNRPIASVFTNFQIFSGTFATMKLSLSWFTLCLFAPQSAQQCSSHSSGVTPFFLSIQHPSATSCQLPKPLFIICSISASSSKADQSHNSRENDEQFADAIWYHVRNNLSILEYSECCQ
ncbi:hypothetical protein FGO68_gene12627 [Halteria grandinella]|uniref:Uncharacterized protein n=1 Tax=Halteria grandinella TaxID=5974 RepID=A0A8J8NMB1_HALGN|nr:hypothetical protein FGO68_gene12627 [Halteria grandinella]